MTTVMILSLSDLAKDPRVDRQIRFLRGQFDIVAVGFAPPRYPGIPFVPVVEHQKRKGPLGKAKTAFRWFSGALDARIWERGFLPETRTNAETYRADIVIVNDILTLPLACGLAEKWNAKILFDAHEYAPREFEDRWRWRWFQRPLIQRLCREYIPRVHAMTTVCQGIADAYQDMTGVSPAVLTNAPEYQELPVRDHVPGTSIRLVHHGADIPSRKLENMIHMMDHLDGRFDLTFLLAGTNWPYRRKLEQLAEKSGRVKFLPAVDMRQLPRFLNQFDVGLFLLEPTNFNYLHALPNKLFEFIQARLAVAIGPSPQMAEVVAQTGVGVVGADFKPATLAAELNRLSSDDINQFKRRSNEAAPRYCAEINRRLLLDICHRLESPALRKDLAAA